LERRRRKVVDVVAQQAALVITRGSRFQVRKEVVGSDDDLRRLINHLAVTCRANVRAYQHDGLVTLYSEDSDVNTEVVVATLKVT
jgi:hypothetical protein